MELTAPELWSRILDGARSGLPEQSFRTWLAGTTAEALSEDELHVEAPSQFHVEWIEDKYGELLGRVAERIVGRPLSLRFSSAAQGPPQPPVPDLEVAASSPGSAPGPEGAEARSRGSAAHPSGAAAAQGGAGRTAARGGPGSTLNDRYTFDRFVVGSNNQLAAAACHAVAEKPARMYNPLFLYGGVGLGKTHLMHAIGNEVLGRDAARSIAYVSSERFMNELITSIQEGQTAQFRRRYREMDLLLVDDVHFLSEKERTQEEFFHTFNALYDAQKQIILTSDRPPKEIPGLESRLVSRFEWGLVADIKPPDYETRVAILRKKAADDDLTLAEDVIDFIARSCTSSVRELEGAVIKLLAFSSLTNQEITETLARTALRGMIRDDAEGDSEVTAEGIRDTVAKRWNVTTDGLVSRRRTKNLTVPRQVAMYLIKETLDLPLVRIGELFGGRDHSTVIHSIRKVEDEMETDPSFRDEVEDLRDTIQRPL